VANRFGVSTYTVIWANDIANNDLVTPGDVLKIPPVSGVLYTVQADDSLPALADKFGVDLNTVLNFPLNKIDNPDELIAGQVLIFPGGVKPAPVRATDLTPALGASASAATGLSIGSGGPASPPSGAVIRPGKFGWPSGGYISQGYWAGHQAIDIAAPFGSPLYAVESGTVVAAAYGWNGGYGTVVDIDHGGGYVSRYAHLSDMYVTKGQTVARGAVIGKIGLTGITTGPHVHFEILLNGVRQNPTFFLGY
jgi:murein DD-endopeptidase MepM/ murein hydrolase activator NlpD